MPMRTVIWTCLWAGLWAAGAAAAEGGAVPKEYGRSPNSYSLPPNYSSFGKDIDSLFWLITWIVGILFVITEVGILYFLFAYRRRNGSKATYTHGNTTLEVVWTIVPAVILVWLSLYQKSLWDKVKIEMPPEPAVLQLSPTAAAGAPASIAASCDAMAAQDVLVVQVLAKQFDWSFRYRGPDDRGRLAPFGTKWDVYSDKLLVPLGTRVVFHVSSKDVIHSFWLPNFRVKQDAVPGLTVRGWFDTVGLTEADIPAGGRGFEIVCAELCGAEHFKMSGVMLVLTRKEFAEQMKLLIDRFRSEDNLLDYGSGRDPRHSSPRDTKKVWKNYRIPAAAAAQLAAYLAENPSARVTDD
jgi:cytochrome c oxidase subunit 2